MPKKGGKKGGGGKQMTEEERLVFMQKNAEAEEANAKLKEDQRTQTLMDKLQKEEQNSKVNLKKLNQQWRSNLLQARAAELREDFAILRQTFERVVDCKDNAIKLLVDDLSEAEQQSAVSHRAHLQCVDHLLEVQKSRLAALDSHWNTSLEEVSTEYSRERERLLKQHQQETEYLEAATVALEQHYDEISSVARQDEQFTRNDVKTLPAGGSTAKEMWQRYQQELQKYTEATEEQKEKAADLHCAFQKTKLDGKHLQKLQETINALRSDLSSTQQENEALARCLRTECEEVTEKVQQLRAKLCSAQEAERTRLVNQIKCSDNACKKLQDIMGKGERLLSLADICRKLETEQEKVLPFYTSSVNAEELSQEKAHAMEAMSEELGQKMMDYTDLEKFWQRYNKVLLERLCLEREKKVLGEENQQLRILLKQYLDGISVSDEILQQQNALLMVSCSSLHASPASETQAHPRRTVIEAAHVVQHIL
ncbi:dynein regulatory complex subunit 2 isoform X2 [Ictalurus furcatus]|uniref:dynein regulatory complex subunit 2 isoform X2 n=1 Tax=Ictalurus furcatus TaxID=66913 RepID=UPI002350F4B8|nr:dynein regulatory complex subunit 2 isoform X2 [Ictalurus furcatus]